MLDSINIDNHQISVDNIYATGDLAFLVILLGKEFFHLEGILNASYIKRYN